MENDCPESIYRNRFLVEAMRNLNMIDYPMPIVPGIAYGRMIHHKSLNMLATRHHVLSNSKRAVMEMVGSPAAGTACGLGLSDLA